MALDRINATALLDGGVTTADIADDAVTTAKLATQTGNVDFADGGRIRLGDSQDLQIYHNGNNSYIDDTGTGNLYIRASDTVRLQSATGEQGVIVTTDGAVTLYHDNGAKLSTTATGIDVTGTVVSDGLTVDTNTLYVDSTNNRVGIGTSSPANKLEVSGAIVAQGAVTAYTNTGLYLQNKGSSVFDVGAWRSGASVTELSFSTDSGSDAAPVERMRIDSSGNVGIGTSSPAEKLEVHGTETTGGVEILLANSGDGGNTTAYTSIRSKLNPIRNGGEIRFGRESGYTSEAAADSNLQFYTAVNDVNTERMRITSAGRVGIGTSSPTGKLNVYSGDSGATTDGSADELFLEQAGNSGLTIGTPNTSTASIFFADPESSSAGRIQYLHTSNSLTFGTAAAERMRINSSGNVGIGTSSPDRTLSIKGSSTTNIPLTVESGSGQTTSLIAIRDPNTTSPYAVAVGSNTDDLFFRAGGSERMRITSTGNVGIGTSSPLTNLVTVGTTMATSQAFVGSVSDTSYSGGIINLSNTSRSIGITSDPTNAGASSILNFSVDGSERMRITSAGNVGIGTTGATYPLTVSTTSGTIARFAATTNTVALEINSPVANYIALKAMASDGLIFSTNNTEKMRIDTSGRVLVGTTSAGGSEKLAIVGGPCFNMAHASTGTIGVFRTSGISGSIVGSISITGSSTAYNTSSDYRLKEDWQSMSGSIDRVKALNPVNFAWKIDDTRVDGFLAHEVQTVVPEAISGTHNEIDAEGNPVYQGIDQSKLVPLLTAALQEAITKIETLEARVTTLESN